MNKRGDYWSTTLLIMTIVMLGWMSYLALTNSSPIERATGMSSVLLFNFFDEVETDLIYCDKALEYSFSDSLNELLLNGGFFEIEDKKVGNYVLWKRDVDECYPTEDRIKKNLGLYLNKSIVEKLDNNNLSGDFEFKFEKEDGKLKILGEPTKKLNYSRDLDNIHIDYEVDPVLVLFLDYDLDEIMLKVLEVKEIVNSCGDNPTCWGNNADFDWTNDEKWFMFEVNIGKIKDVFGETDLVLKGAVYFGSSLGEKSLVC